MTLDPTHDTALRCWVEGADGHADFPVQNLPLGVALIDGERRIVTAIGDHALVLGVIAALLPEGVRAAVAEPTLNALFALPASERAGLRAALSRLLTDEAQAAGIRGALRPRDGLKMCLPAQIGDYTDFYVGIHHANNVGKQFRPDNPLLPNYKWVPIGYHGRASSVRVSGEDVRRPNGQRKAPDADAPVLGPSQRLDYELELAVWIGEGNALGEPIPIGEAAQHIAGIGLLNDWSARDLQAWEYQPLGPFLAKNFHSTVSPWVVTMEALAPYRIAQPKRAEGDPQPLPYLHDEADQAGGAFALTLETQLLTAKMAAAGEAPVTIGRGPASNAYWTLAQLVTHHSVGGCNMQPGDLLGSGTISTPDDSGLGSLLELTRGGQQPITLPNGEERRFLEDGDTVILTAYAEAPGHPRIGFGECRGTVTPAPVI